MWETYTQSVRERFVRDFEDEILRIDTINKNYWKNPERIFFRYRKSSLKLLLRELLI